MAVKEESSDFVAKQREIYENILLEQKQQITILKRQIHKLQQEVENYKRNEKEICDAFIYSMEQKNQVKEAQDNLYQLELQRVRDLYERYRKLFEEKMNEPARKIGKEIDKQFNLLEEIGKDVDMEQAFSGFDFFDNNPTNKKQDERRKKILEHAMEIRKQMKENEQKNKVEKISQKKKK